MDNRIPEIILASASPRRRELLSLLVPRFSVIHSRVDETGFDAGSPEKTALVLAREKGNEVARRSGKSVVLAADTVIDFQGELLGKPLGGEDAFEMLSRLRGKKHRVLTALYVTGADSGDNGLTSLVASEVKMAEVSDEAIREYVASGEPIDKAGSYAIQGLGRALVAGFSGCYTNIVGLPVCEVENLLSQFLPAGDFGRGQCRLPGGERCPRY